MNQLNTLSIDNVQSCMDEAKFETSLVVEPTSRTSVKRIGVVASEFTAMVVHVDGKYLYR